MKPDLESTKLLSVALAECEADRQAKWKALERLDRALSESEADRRDRLEVIKRLDKALKQTEAELQARLEVIEQLDAALKESEADRQTQRTRIERLDAALKESEADRQARLEVIERLDAGLKDATQLPGVRPRRWAPLSRVMALPDRALSRRCPVCGAAVEHFRPLSAEFTEPAQQHGWPYSLSDSETINPAEYSCPYCDAVDRERMSALWILRAATTGGRLLHIGPRAGIDRFLRERFDVRSADLEAEADDQVDIQVLPYPDGMFDAFICSHVLEHVGDDRAALRELRRVLRPEGWGIVIVPIILSLDAIDEEPAGVSEEEAWRRFGQGDHLRLYNRNGFLARVAEAGFRTAEHRFGVVDRRRYGIGRGSVLYTVTCA